MKPSPHSLFASILVILFIAGCSKKDPTPVTSLQLTVDDNLGNPVSGATVKLYASQTDWSNDTNSIGLPQISDPTGKVTFTNLSAIQYFWYAEKNCDNNVNGSVKTTSAIPPNIVTALNTVLTGTGTLDFINNSSDPYSVYVNNAPAFTASAGHSYTLSYAPIGAYSVEVVQQSGYVISPTDITYTGTLVCGGTLTTTFPN